MGSFREHDVVRIISTDGAGLSVSDIVEAMRPPEVGDVGTVVALDPLLSSTTVECVSGDGRTAWIAEFAPGDLELVERGTPTLLQAENLRKAYKTEAGELDVLRGVSMDVREGEMVAVVGESGTGKSTLLHLLGALDRPSAGAVRYRDRDVFAQSDDRLAQFRNEEVGFVFQFHHLLPEFSALENVAMPALISGKALRGETEERARGLLQQFGLGERLQHRPSQLSGGEQQRVAIARALMNRPGLVLADEPTGNLDGPTAERLHLEIRRLANEGQAFVVVTHNPALAALADRTLHLERGQFVEASAPGVA
jgi:lipoprotein-releasing system ATP-binding protein